MYEYTVYFGHALGLLPCKSYRYIKLWLPELDNPGNAIIQLFGKSSLLYAARTEKGKHLYAVVKIGWNMSTKDPQHPRYMYNSGNTTNRWKQI